MILLACALFIIGTNNTILYIQGIVEGNVQLKVSESLFSNKTGELCYRTLFSTQIISSLLTTTYNLSSASYVLTLIVWIEVTISLVRYNLGSVANNVWMLYMADGVSKFITEIDNLAKNTASFTSLLPAIS